MVWKVGFKPTTFGQCCYRWVFYLNILWFPISSAYIFIIMMFGTLGRIIFIHLLRSTVVECLFAIIQLTSVLTSYSLHRFYRILLGHFTQNRRAIRLHHFPNWNSKTSISFFVTMTSCIHGEWTTPVIGLAHRVGLTQMMFHGRFAIYIIPKHSRTNPRRGIY